MGLGSRIGCGSCGQAPRAQPITTSGVKAEEFVKCRGSLRTAELLILQLEMRLSSHLLVPKRHVLPQAQHISAREQQQALAFEMLDGFSGRFRRQKMVDVCAHPSHINLILVMYISGVADM